MNLAGCLCAIGGAGSTRLGILWFDAHGEFNTPETTRSGFLDGMGLATATGLCWKQLADSIPGFRPVPGSNILLVGGRDFDEGEQGRLEQSGVTVIDNAMIETSGLRDALQPGIAKLAADIDEVHVHIDPDALNSKEAPANSYQFMTEGGMSVEQLHESIALIQKERKITSATIASFDPEYDSQGKTTGILFELAKQILDS